MHGASCTLEGGNAPLMAEKITAADDMVLSHPHPHLLSLGPLATVTTRLASRFDRLRDRTVNNRQPPPAST